MPTKSLEDLKPVHRRAAGIDVGSAENYVAIPAEGLAPGESPVRVFGVFSAEQDALVEWLAQHQITTVAMEATGIYWLSLYDKLEAAGIEVYLVDPHGVKAVPGRKSDWLDCQWLQKLHTYGLLAKAFRPDLPVRRLRTLTRQRSGVGVLRRGAPASHGQGPGGHEPALEPGGQRLGGGYGLADHPSHCGRPARSQGIGQAARCAL